MVWWWIPIVGILLGLLLWHGEQPEVREAKAKTRREKRAKSKPRKKKTRKRKPRGTIIIADGISLTSTGNQELRDLETLPLIDDFEEEIFEDDEGM